MILPLPPSSPNKQNTDAPFVDMAQLKLRKEIVVVAPLFLARLGIAAPAAENESFDSGFRRSSLSAKNNGGVLLNVIYRKECQEKNTPLDEQAGVRALTFGHTFAVSRGDHFVIDMAQLKPFEKN